MNVSKHIQYSEDYSHGALHYATPIAEMICSHYSVSMEAVTFLGFSQNYVYEVLVNGTEPGIVRVTDQEHRAEADIVAELDWIRYLREQGVHVCAPVRLNGNPTCVHLHIEDRGFTSVVFEKAPGVPLDRTMLDADLYERHGRLVGQMHRLTKGYRVSDAFPKRPHWSENRLYKRDPYEYLNANQKGVIEVMNELMEQAARTPETPNAFGLVHLDLHYNNLHQCGRTLTLYDFDNCARGYFVDDIVKALYSSVFTAKRKKELFDDSIFLSPSVDLILDEVWHPFLKGYESEQSLDPSWFDFIPVFWLLTEIREFVHHHRCGTPRINQIVAADFERRQSLIERRTMSVKYDFRRGRPVVD